MKKILKKLYFVGREFLQTIISIISVLFFNQFGIRSKIQGLSKVRERSVAIIANGPSAKEIILNKPEILQESDILVLNYFGNTYDFFTLKPLYYILLDPAFFDTDFRDISLKEEKADVRKSAQGTLFENLKKIDWPMTLFIPYTRGSIRKKNILLTLSNIKIVEFHATRILGYNWFQNWMYKQNQGIPSSRNVIIPAIILMANIGYKIIYLYGCEFSWTKTMDVDITNGKMFFNDKHFYSNSEIRYFGKGGYKWWLEAIVDMLNATEQIASYAKKINVNIVNRTKGSFIDAFEYSNPDLISLSSGENPRK